MPEDLVGYSAEQDRRIVRAVRWTEQLDGSNAGVKPRSNAYLPPVRLICMEDREYDSRTTQRCPMFILDEARTVFTVEQVGSALAGYLALIVNGSRYLVECRRETIVLPIPGLRVTVFPGLWEFDFGERTDPNISVEVEQITDDEDTSLCELFDDEDSVIFTGSVIVRQEMWVSVEDRNSLDDLPVSYTSVRDCIPYQTSSVPAGAMGIAHWMWDAGYIAGAWQCRTFSHANGYVQADDPVALEAV